MSAHWTSGTGGGEQCFAQRAGITHLQDTLAFTVSEYVVDATMCSETCRPSSFSAAVTANDSTPSHPCERQNAYSSHAVDLQRAAVDHFALLWLNALASWLLMPMPEPSHKCSGDD